MRLWTAILGASLVLTLIGAGVLGDLYLRDRQEVAHLEEQAASMRVALNQVQSQLSAAQQAATTTNDAQVQACGALSTMYASARRAIYTVLPPSGALRGTDLRSAAALAAGRLRVLQTQVDTTAVPSGLEGARQLLLEGNATWVPIFEAIANSQALPSANSASQEANHLFGAAGKAIAAVCPAG